MGVDWEAPGEGGGMDVGAAEEGKEEEEEDDDQMVSGTTHPAVTAHNQSINQRLLPSVCQSMMVSSVQLRISLLCLSLPENR